MKAGVLGNDPLAPPLFANQARSVRTALQREVYKRGDLLLISWLVVLCAGLGGWVWELVGQDRASVSVILGFATAPNLGPPMPLWGALAAAVAALFVQTIRWVRVQKQHLSNVVRLRGKRERRLRLGDTASAELRERVERKAKERRAAFPLRSALIVMAIIGVLAAITVPNLFTALNRSKQKRTMADMRSVAMATEAFGVDNSKYPAIEGNRLSALAKQIQPVYIKVVPEVDGWGHPMRYYSWQDANKEADKRDKESGGFGFDESMRGLHYAFVSAGRDGVFEHEHPRDYRHGTRADFDNDVVFQDGIFTVYPEDVISN
jgi:general secretion pathway protein G